MRKEPGATRLVEGGAETHDEGPAATLFRAALAAVPVVTRLDEAAARELVWRQLSAELFSAKAPRLRRWCVVAASGAMALGLWLVVTSAQRAPRSAIESTIGGVFTATSGGWQAATQGTRLVPGSRVRTEAAGQATLAIDRASVGLSAGAELTVTSLGAATELRLSGGSLVATVEHRQPTESFVVRTARYRVAVRGTIFTVQERSPADVRVSVSRGMVEVTGEGDRWEVRAGSSWSSLMPSVTPQRGPPAAATSEAGPPAMRPSERPSEQRPVEHLRTRPLTLATADPAKPPSPAVVPAPIFAPMAASVQGVTDPTVVARDLLRAGREAEAVRVLERAVAAAGPSASLALYQLGQLRRGRLRDPAGALDAFLQYGRAFPHGDLAQEAELSAIQLQVERSDLDPALAEMNHFLAQHPESERAAEVHLLRGNVLRTRGELVAALADYDRARGDGDRAIADDARFYAAFCEQQLGRQAAARADFGAYLAQFPQGMHASAARTALGR